MLERTFIHAPGIGAVTEQKLWSRGFESWRRCLDAPADLPLGQASRRSLISTLEDSVRAMSRRDSRFFARALPPNEHWRAARAFSTVGYLDIETDGGTTITVIGLYDGSRVRQFVWGENLVEFVDEVDRYDVFVTFFGSGFDIPMLRRAFPQIAFDALHCDLCFALRKLGYRGGLKSIERTLAIRRSPETAGLDGWDAVRLWREYRMGSREALDLLLAYNAEDIVNLEPLLDLAVRELSRRLTGPGQPGKMSQ